MPLALAASLALATPATAKSGFEEAIDRIVAEVKQDRFELWNACRPMILFVRGLVGDKDAAKIGLTEKDVMIAVRSRLRAARMYADKGNAVLRVSVFVGDLAFSLAVKFRKRVKDAVSGENGWATTWEAGSFGTHGGKSEYVLSTLKPHVDEFIDEYLRVNENACSR